MDHVWIYREDTQEFRKLARDDERFDWKWPHSPQGTVKFTTRAPKKWTYVPWGETIEACQNSVNRFRLREIDELTKKIEEVRSRMVNLSFTPRPDAKVVQAKIGEGI